MFFRRMFGRKGGISGIGGELNDDEDGNDMDETDENDNDRNWSDYEFQRNRRHSKRNAYRRNDGAATAPAAIASSSLGCDSAGIRHRNTVTTGAAGTTSSSPSLQLTPLWEHILRTRTLPENVCPAKMFVEFNERLRDPEWQVRQHALRVFVDVLVVMCNDADAYMEAVIPQLVENLGHPAPTVRKGALDCLRVYLTETAMPETIMLQILDIGLNQKITNEPFGGRLTCGVMLSLPALVQSTLHQTPKRHFILRATIDMLIQKMGQVTHQEITLKVLSKIRELIGEREFMEFMSHGAYREFELLCNVYGVGRCKGEEELAKTNSNASWRYIPKPAPMSCWRSSDEEQMLDCASHGKVIMETEIKINDDTLTMRILEAKDDECDELTGAESSPCKLQENEYLNSLEDEIVCGRLASARSEREITGVIEMLSDSEVDDNNKTNNRYFTVVTPSTPSRTPKRVTFGGEVVKMRTPDSDATTSNNSSNNGNSHVEPVFTPITEGNATISSGTELPTNNIPDSKTSELCVEIPNDNTKPLPRPRTAQSPRRTQNTEMSSTPKQSDITIATSPATSVPSTTTASNSPQSPIKRQDSTNSLSPRSPFKRISISPVDSIISPKTQHKEIEVLHNLQRDPSPIRVRSAKATSESECITATQTSSSKDSKSRETPPPPKTWEDLGIVDYDTLEDLRSGNWCHRFQGIIQLEEALRSSDNLALVQPCLDSLLRTLLSSERNQEVSEAKHRLLTNLISRLPLDNLEDRTVQILTGLCRQGGAGANRVCKSLMQRLLPAVIVLKLISQEFLHAKSSRFREHALQMVMYALMTHPSTSFDTQTCIRNATFAALNRKRRVRQAALDVLAILGQVTTTRAVMDVVERIADETQRDDGAALVAAVKARLSRKQLPLVTADGIVQYTVRINGTQGTDGGNGQLGPDIEWITAGVGSVSPTSLRRRAHRTRSSSRQSFCCLPSQEDNSGSGIGHFQNERCVPNYANNVDGNQRLYGKNDENQSYKLQHVLGNNFSLTARRTNLDFLNYKNRRLVAKSCSDSSMEGRSSDSTYTSSSGGGGNGEGNITAAGDSGTGESGGITGRFTRQTINSRFPSMDLNSKYIRVHRPPVYQPGMGAYAHLQQQQYHISSTHPKISYSLPHHQRRRSHQLQQQVLHVPQPYQQQQKSSSLAQESFKQTETYHKQQNNAEDEDNLDGTYIICEGVSMNTNDRTSAVTPKTSQKSHQHQHQYQQHAIDGSNNTARRFVNVQKFRQQSNNSPPTDGQSFPTSPSSSPENQNNSKQPTPGSAKSISYSQKSTASASSGGTRDSDITRIERTDMEDFINNEILAANEASANSNSDMPPEHNDTEPNSVEEHIVTNSPNGVDEGIRLKRSTSILSLQSKTESIKTQLDDTPPTVSRTQSLKSLVIEEDIEGAESFFVVEEILSQQLSASAPENTGGANCNSPTIKNDNEIEVRDEIDGETPRDVSKSNTASGRCSPTIADLKTLSRRNSLIKSMESLYERETIAMKQDPFETATETSSQSSNQAQQLAASPVTPVKPQHTPLKQKAKSCFLRSHRRISPVKQSIKMQQVELYPATLQPFDKPREALLKTFDQLDSPNWEIIMQGLKAMVRLMRYHPDHLENQMHMVCIQLTRSVRNLRSQVARAACQASMEIFNLKSKALEQECDDLVGALLHRTADTNRFLRADATRALESMCNNLSPSKILNILTTKGALHQHGLVRTSTAKLLHGLVVRLGYEKVYQMPREYRDKFFVTGANLLLEGSLETRTYAKAIFRLLSEHPSYNRLLLEVIPTRTYRNVEKTLKTIQ